MAITTTNMTITTAYHTPCDLCCQSTGMRLAVWMTTRSRQLEERFVSGNATKEKIACDCEFERDMMLHL